MSWRLIAGKRGRDRFVVLLGPLRGPLAPFMRGLVVVTRRTDRMNGILRREISQLLSHQVNDPRLSGVISITKVDTSSDLRLARVFVSVLGSRDEKDTAIRGVNSAMGFIRRELGGRLYLRNVPDLKFILDESIEEAEQLFKMIDRLSDAEPPPSDGGRQGATHPLDT